MRRLKKTIVAVLSVVLAFNLCLCFPLAGTNVSSNAYDKAGNKDKDEDNGTEEERQGRVAGDFIPEYYHYEKEDFVAFTDKVTEAAKAGDEDALIKAYDDADSELRKIGDLYSAIYLYYADDVSNKDNNNEMDYTTTLSEDCDDLFCTICHDVIASGDFPKLREHIGDGKYEYYMAYEPLPDEIKDIRNRITDLVSDYYHELYRMDELTAEVDGKEITWADFNSDEAEKLAEADPLGYIYALLTIEEKFNSIVGPIYQELVGLRAKIADYYGYDNYAEYVYKEVYSREYSLEEAEEFCDMVKKKIAPLYYDMVYYGSLSDSDINYTSNIYQILDDLGYLAGKVSPIAEKAFKEFSEKKMYDLGYDSKRLDGSFTSAFSSTGEPFIFTHFVGGHSDLSTMTHEFGHYAYLNQSDQDILSEDSFDLDLLEMHSNGFEVLCTKYYDKFFGDKASLAEANVLGELLGSLVSGCIEDEFQRKVYANPDMSLDEMNELYADIVSDYSEMTFGSRAYEWCLIPHNFESPMYYISYAVSSFTALELWDSSKTDYENAVTAWETLLKCADDKESYETTMEKCGLSTITDSEAVEKICNNAFSTIAEATGQSVDSSSENDFPFFSLIDLLWELIRDESLPQVS